MDDAHPIDRMAQQAPGRDFEDPPLEQWTPDYSGTMDLRIDAEGNWWHEGRPFARADVMRMLARLLRREEDGHYYLVTPVEKWRIQVEAHPLSVIDFEGVEADGASIFAVLNSGRRVELRRKALLQPDPLGGEAPVLRLEHGLSARPTRAAWYRLVDAAVPEEGEMVVYSRGERFSLGSS